MLKRGRDIWSETIKLANYFELLAPRQIEWGCVRGNPRRIHTDQEVHIQSKAFATVRIWDRS